MATKKYIGIDGCRGGWFVVCLDENDRGIFSLIHHVSEITTTIDSVETLLIDIPIGLKRHQKEERSCDKQARALLQPSRGASVFPAPSRCALNSRSYEDAVRRNRQCTGRGLSKQSFWIMPKIREVDEFVRSGRCDFRIREMHPELCFWALNNKRPMSYRKKSRDGYEERMALLCRYYPKSRELVERALLTYKQKEVARDDIVDALVGAVTARHADSLRALPLVPEIDDEGLAMEIVYWEPSGNG
jgi:predicted RNase H-like nuclease